MVNEKDFMQAVKDAMSKTFGFNTEVGRESKIAKDEKSESEIAPGTEKKEEIDIKNTWVWVEGYKGTNKNMCCQGFQYELGKKYQMPRESVDECRTGYHLCLNMHDVQKYYSIGNGNRFFKVRALVRLSNKNDYGKMPDYDPSNMYHRLFDRQPRNKLVAAEIEFLEELTMDEILENTIAKNWTEEYKKMAIELSVDAANRTRQIDTLTGYGYSLPFASYLIENKKYNVAKAVGSQSDLSMDMKCLLILQG